MTENMDLNVLAMNAMRKMEQEGKLQDMITKQVESTMQEVVKDLFGKWSDFSKNMKKEIEEQLKINFKDLNLSTYNELIMQAVAESINDEIAVEGVARIQENIKNLVGSTKDEYKLSELVKEMMYEVDRSEIGFEEMHEMTVDIDTDFSLSTIISMDPDNDVTDYNCKYRFWVSKDTGLVHNIEINEKHRTGKRSISDFDARAIMRGMHGVEKILFQMYARGSKLIIDEDDLEVEIHGSDDE